eukprot:scaffold2851_cov114-Isochrysis_galbana.AAC.1
MPHLRGFSTNVANYDPTGSSSGCPAAALAPGETVGHWCNWVQPDHPCCKDDRCNLVAEYNSGPCEVVFAQARPEPTANCPPAHALGHKPRRPNPSLLRGPGVAAEPIVPEVSRPPFQAPYRSQPLPTPPAGPLRYHSSFPS